MDRETRIRAKLRELADALQRLAQHVPGEDGAELERCALDLHPGAADRAAPRAGKGRRLLVH
jgi:hypothetical protein